MLHRIQSNVARRIVRRTAWSGLSIAALATALQSTAIAHPGHGITPGNSAVHLLIEPGHDGNRLGLWLIAIAAMLVVIGIGRLAYTLRPLSPANR